MVKINVRDMNDNRPVFYPATYSVNLAPNSQPGTEVAVVMATDRDSGRLGAVTYSISSGNAQGYFGIGETSGEQGAAELASVPLFGIHCRDTCHCTGSLFWLVCTIQDS